MKTSVMRSVMLLALLGFGCIAQAATINYTISGNGSGKLGKTKFEDTAFTISLSGEYADAGSNFLDAVLNTSISIAGMGAADFLSTTRLGFNPATGLVSLSELSVDKHGKVTGKEIFSFNVKSTGSSPATGPAQTENFDIFAVSHFKNLDTGLGKLKFDNSASFVSGTMSMVSVSAVPLPGAVWLFGSGLLAFFGISRKKKVLATA